MPGHESENDHEELKRHSSPRLSVQDVAEPRQKNSCEKHEVGIERPPWRLFFLGHGVRRDGLPPGYYAARSTVAALESASAMSIAASSKVLATAGSRWVTSNLISRSKA